MISDIFQKTSTARQKRAFFDPNLFFKIKKHFCSVHIYTLRFILFLNLNPLFIAILPLNQNLFRPKSVKFEQGSKCFVHRHPLNLLPFWQILPFKIIRNGCYTIKWILKMSSKNIALWKFRFLGSNFKYLWKKFLQNFA